MRRRRQCADGRCVVSGEACLNQGTALDLDVWFEGTACEGTTLVACVSGRVQRRDCTTIDPRFSCQSAEGRFFFASAGDRTAWG
jgi:hypothetical protein